VTLYGDKWLVVINKSWLQSSVSALQRRLSSGTIIFAGLGVCGSYRAGLAHTRDSGYRRGAIGVSRTCLKVVMRLYLCFAPGERNGYGRGFAPPFSAQVRSHGAGWRTLHPSDYLERGGRTETTKDFCLRETLVTWTGAASWHHRSRLAVERTWVEDVFSRALTCRVAEPHRSALLLRKRQPGDNFIDPVVRRHLE
jgi:hypothetical protein